MVLFNFFTSVRNFFLGVVTIALSSYFLPPKALSAPCPPSDPDGSNPGSLCPPYATYGMTIYPGHLQPGYASEGFYGTALGPNSPGTPLVPGHVRGTPMAPGSSSNGYWTQIDNANGTSRMQTNTGQQWTLTIQQQ